MTKKIPPLDGITPDQTYDLDNVKHLQELNLNPHNGLKIADRYVHYTNCVHAVVEFEGSHIGKAIKQIEATVDKLVRVGRKVDLAIIELDNFSTYEKRIYGRNKEKELLDIGRSGKPITVFDGPLIRILMYLTREVDQIYRESL